MVNQLSSLLRDVKGMMRRRTMFQKIMCSLLKLCSGQIKELKEKIDRGRKDSLVKSEYDLSVKAEEALVTKYNSLRKRAAKEKTLRLQEVEDKLKGKLEGQKGAV